jgi:hypothetical protein
LRGSIARIDLYLQRRVQVNILMRLKLSVFNMRGPCHSGATQASSQSTAGLPLPLHFHFHFTSTSLPLHFHFTSTSLPLHFHFTSTSLPLHFTSTSLPLHPRFKIRRPELSHCLSKTHLSLTDTLLSPALPKAFRMILTKIFVP